RQVDEITELLARAGYSSFREARHVFGLTQRQASGRFTRDEAVELIDRLRAESGEAEPSEAGATVTRTDRGAERQAELLAAVPADDLADELVRRGWMCVPPV
ncbi:MAG: hypothetical protein ACXWCB_17760, partial [Acidimicrobiales bacterium]